MMPGILHGSLGEDGPHCRRKQSECLLLLDGLRVLVAYIALKGRLGSARSDLVMMIPA